MNTSKNIQAGILLFIVDLLNIVNLSLSFFALYSQQEAERIGSQIPIAEAQEESDCAPSEIHNQAEPVQASRSHFTSATSSSHPASVRGSTTATLSDENVVRCFELNSIQAEVVNSANGVLIATSRDFLRPLFYDQIFLDLVFRNIY